MVPTLNYWSFIIHIIYLIMVFQKSVMIQHVKQINSLTGEISCDWDHFCHHIQFIMSSV